MKPVAKVRKDQLAPYLDEHQLTAVSARRRDTRVVFAQALAPVVTAADEKRLVRITGDGHANLRTRVQQALAGQGYALIVYSMDQMRNFIAFPVFEHTMNRIKDQLGDVVTVLEPGFYGRFHMFCVACSDLDADLPTKTAHTAATPKKQPAKNALNHKVTTPNDSRNQSLFPTEPHSSGCSKADKPTGVAGSRER